jgi:hypothetical protein
MKYDLVIHLVKCWQAFCLTVRHALTHFHYVIAPADSYIKTIDFPGIYSIYSVLQGIQFGHFVRLTGTIILTLMTKNRY